MLSYANGDRYEGAWENNRCHGSGVFTSPDFMCLAPVLFFETARKNRRRDHLEREQGFLSQQTGVENGGRIKYVWTRPM